jgi:hypothetical protein
MNQEAAMFAAHALCVVLVYLLMRRLAGTVAARVAALVFALVRRLAGPGQRSMLIAAGCAAWCSTLAAALGCAAQLAASGIVPWTTVLPAMGAVHVVIGLAEAVITMLVLAVVVRALVDGRALSGLGEGVPLPACAMPVTRPLGDAPAAAGVLLPDGPAPLPARVAAWFAPAAEAGALPPWMPCMMGL